MKVGVEYDLSAASHFPLRSLHACAWIDGHRRRAASASSLISSRGCPREAKKAERTHSGPNWRLADIEEASTHKLFDGQSTESVPPKLKTCQANPPCLLAPLVPGEFFLLLFPNCRFLYRCGEKPLKAGHSWGEVCYPA